MRTSIIRTCLLATSCCLVHGQTSEKQLTFEAASVKPYQFRPGAGRLIGKPTGGPGTGDPGRIHYPAVSLEFLLLTAYDVYNFQMVGPDWLKSERFDIDATLPADTTTKQFHEMLQNLLLERFKLTVHREHRELPGYSLVVAKSGPKMKVAADLPAQDDGAADPPLRLGADGFFVPPQRAGVFLQMTTFPAARATFRQMKMRDFANSLQAQLRRPVTDATGLTAKYDFTLNFSMDGLDLGSGRIPISPGDGETPLDIFGALESQIGLKLEPKKALVDLIVIDHMEKAPTGN